MTDRIFVGGGGEGHATAQHLLLAQANRHGLIAGATGTGKTVTLQILAEGFSSSGVPVFAADVKGDLSGIAMPGSEAHRLHAAFAERARTIGWDLSYRGFPVAFWDVFGQSGTPIRATPAEMGPLLLARMLELTEAQEGVLNVAFRLADEEGLPILDLKDLRALLVFVGENAEEIGRRYGLVATASVAAIQRQILILENQGAEAMFGEPALDLSDLMRTDAEGRGVVNILAADRLMQAPRAYATFLLWLLSELFESLPEVGDPEKPRLVFFFDEAHLLFTDAPRSLVARIEQLARLIRSKGVGVYFITQNPADLPEVVLGQLGNRVQHGLRAFTPKDQQDLERAARTYRPNPRFAVDVVMRELATGEAVTSFLEPKGVPGVAERTLVHPPQSRLGPITPDERAALVAASPMEGKYRREVDRDSAYERLRAREEAAAGAAAEAAEGAAAAGVREAPSPWGTPVPASGGSRARRIGTETATTTRPAAKPAARRNDSLGEAFAKSFVRQVGTRTGQAVVRGLLGSLFKGR